MATAKAKAQPVGSSQWVRTEREQAADFVGQEAEEYSYSVRNEMDWLNEHMADIFSKTQMNFADVFKTPGKLRGKTPRTARKRDALAPRQPLTDIFATNAPSTLISPQKPNLFTKAAHFDIAEDAENHASSNPPTKFAMSTNHAVVYTDSGYHGSTEDEMDVDCINPTIDASTQETQASKIPLRDNEQPRKQTTRDGKGDDAGASDDSFVSAKEPGTQESNTATIPDDAMGDVFQRAMAKQEEAPSLAEVNAINAVIGEMVQDALPKEDVDIVEDVELVNEEMEDAETQHSDVSSPEKPLQRKSSFNFSALPAREPLGAKKSMGPGDVAHRSSMLGRSLSARNIELEHAEAVEHEHETSVETKEHAKTTTQLLQERIKSLGKSKEPRPSKSIPSSTQAAQVTYPQLPGMETEVPEPGPATHQESVTADEAVTSAEQTDNNRIAPISTAASTDFQSPAHADGVIPESRLAPSRPPLHQKSMSATHISSPRPEIAQDLRHQKAISVSHPNLSQFLESMTPAGSPTAKKNYEGPLSASKNRLWSALKSAKSIFASSASASAAAKLEAHKDSPSTKKTFSGETHNAAVFSMPGALYSEQQLLQSPSRPVSVISQSPSRKTRSSSESDKRREKELKAQQKATEDLEKAREKEREKAAKQQEQERAKAEKAQATRMQNEKQPNQDRPMSADSSRTEMAPPPPPKSGGMGLGKLRAPGRLVKPKETPSAKPAPVSIRVASQSQRLGQGTNSHPSLSKSQHEASAPQPPPKDSISRTASAQSNRSGASAASNARVKALEAAARKKEADEKVAQRKAEQKRDLERKRAAKAEEEKRAEEERKAAEQQRLQEAKIASQRKAEKLAAEARKREQERAEQQRREQERLEQQKEQQKREEERLEQQKRELEAYRQQEEARKAKEAHELAEAIRRERAQPAQPHPRGDIVGTLRQLVKSTVPVHSNPAKPAKRVFNPDEDEMPQRPGTQRGPPSFQQNEAKRRRTSDEFREAAERPSVMAPPKRPSNWRKDTLTKFPHGYTNAPPSAPNHGNGMFKSSGSVQHPPQHGINKPIHPTQMVQVSNARIPFAENQNSQPIPHANAHAQLHGGHDNGSSNNNNNNNGSAHANRFKTPARPPPGWSGKSAGNTKPNTPCYPNGDAIDLPDIATDSEDEDSEDEATGGFRAPSWVASPALRQLLTQQQLMDPESVFGPIGDLKLDEVFKNGKNPERLKRFRDRGSSALWVESGDAVTSAEKRRDMEMRERVVRDGGWRYEPGV